MSSFHSDGPSNTWGRIVVGGGLGCLLVLLLLGMAVSVGGVKFAQCCQDKMGAERKIVLGPIEAVVDKLGENNMEGAYKAMSEGYRKRASLEEFRTHAQSHGDVVRGGRVELFNMRTPPGDRGRVYIVVRIYEPKTNTEKGLATFVVKKTGEKNAQGKPVYGVEEFFAGAPRALAIQEAVEQVVQLHIERLGRGEVEAAYAQVSDAFTGGSRDAEAFARFVDSQGELLRGGEVVVQELRPVDGTHRTVEISVKLRDPEKDLWKGEAVFKLTLEGRAWKITSIRTQSALPQPGLELPPSLPDTPSPETGPSGGDLPPSDLPPSGSPPVDSPKPSANP